MNLLDYPFDPELVARKAKAIKRSLEADGRARRPLRVAILGGSTTADLARILELFLLNEGFLPTFYESGFNRFYEEALWDSSRLEEFDPEIVWLHTNLRSLTRLPDLFEDDAAVQSLLEAELDRIESIWRSLQGKLSATIIQNNFELPPFRRIGNLESSESFGVNHFVQSLNVGLAARARRHQAVRLNDVHYLSSLLGLDVWHDRHSWFHYKIGESVTATVHLAHNLAKIVGAQFGKSKKCLVTDLDNTLWGGVVGDDGVDNLQLGRDTALGEAFLDFQAYLKDLAKRGVVLAISSKNELSAGLEGLAHPDSLLAVGDFAAHRINWSQKDLSLVEIAKELNLGLDSLVFTDDNPAERELVRKSLNTVAVPEIGDDVVTYARYLDRSGYFEPAALSQEDARRGESYALNALRKTEEASFLSYDDYLMSLEMEAVVGPFEPLYFERLTQMINKTNQFNLTTRRLSLAEVAQMAKDSEVWVTLYGRLKDKFGDNGIVTALAGEVHEGVLTISLWLMSCRVFKRGLEQFMFDRLVEVCQFKRVEKIVGVYLPTEKNAIVKELYSTLGFTERTGSWEFTVTGGYTPLNRTIRRV